MAASFFGTAARIPPDAIFALTAAYLGDESSNKVNLGQGAYRDEHGKPWVLPTVAKARQEMEKEGVLHEYLPISGLKEFRDATAKLVVGSEAYGGKAEKLVTCQSISGTGSLHAIAQLIARCHPQKPKVLIPEPTWSNHFQVFGSLGFVCQGFRYYDSESKTLDMQSYIQALKSAEEGSVLILHTCAHNPTGCDPSEEDWHHLAQIIRDKRLFPIFDSAYLGFNSGSIDKDAFAIRYFINELNLEAAVCISYAKNMGLYGERVGCLVVHTSSAEVAANTASNLEQLQRSEISNPPAYGAKIASTILNSPELRKSWDQDLVTMSSRIKEMRQALYDNLIKQDAPGTWDHVTRQSGMFGFLGLSPSVVQELKEKHHIYMSENSRISVAGLNDSNVAYVAEAIAKCLQ